MMFPGLVEFVHSSKKWSKIVQNLTINRRSEDSVLGIRTCDCRMVGADECTWLWRPPSNRISGPSHTPNKSFAFLPYNFMPANEESCLHFTTKPEPYNLHFIDRLQTALFTTIFNNSENGSFLATSTQTNKICGQSYKHFTLVNYDSIVVLD